MRAGRFALLWAALLVGCDSSPKVGSAGAGGMPGIPGGEAGSAGTARPDTPSETVRETIAPESGGVVTVSDGRLAGTTVTIPPGATDAPIEVTLGEGSPVGEVSLPAGPPIEVGPSGTTFNVPVTVEIPYDSPLPPLGLEQATEEDLVVTIRDDRTGDTERVLPAAIDRERLLVSVQTMHFSTFQAGVELRPDAMRSSLAADRAMARADGQDAIVLSTEVLDSAGVGVAGAEVEIVAGDGALVEPPTARTDSAGRATARLRATTGGPRDVRAKVRSGRASLELGPVAVTFASAAPVAMRFAVEPPMTVEAGAPTGGIAVELVDDRGVRVPGSTAQVSLSLGGEDMGLAGATTVGAVDGLATFADLAATRAGAGLVLRASAMGLAEASSRAFDVTAAAPAELELRVMPGDAVAGQPLRPSPEVVLRDRFGNPVTAGPITVALGGPMGVSLGGTTTRDLTAGVAVFDDLQVQKAGTGYVLIASAPMAPGVMPVMSLPFSITPAPAAALSFTTQPATGAAGQPLAPAPAVKVRDAFGNHVPGATGTVTLELAQNPAAGTLAGTLSVPLSMGAAAFTDVRIDRAGSPYVLRARQEGLASADGLPLTITPGPAARLVFHTAPASGVAGAALAAIVVRVEDAAGNIVPSPGDVTVSLSANPTGAALQGTLTQPLNAGQATFADLRFDKAASTYSLQFAQGALPPLVSAPIAVVPGAATQLVFAAQPTSSVAGAGLSPAVTVRATDAFGNTNTSATPSITLALAVNPGGATLGGGITVTAAGGVASFPGISLDRPGAGYKLSAAATGLATATSASFDIAHGPPSRLVFAVQPTNAAAATPLAPAVQVRIEDALGNLATTATATVSLAFGANPGSAALGGGSASASGGIATFPGVTVSAAGSGYTLLATAGGLASATSSAFNITSPAATKVAFLTQPGGGLVGQGLAGPVTVEVQDAAGNRVTDSSAQVTIVLSNNPNAAQVLGTNVVTASAGVATFPSVALDRSGLGYTLLASASGLASAVSAGFNVNVYTAIDGLGHLDGTTMSFQRGNGNDAANGRSFNNPDAVAIDSVRHRLFVADYNNHRVLVFGLSTANDFTGGDRVADFVLGQSDFQAAGFSLSQTGLRNPSGLVYDSANDRLFVLDSGNRRVMLFATTTITNGMAAAAVIGQPDFITAGATPSNSTTTQPVGGCYDAATNRLFVGDAQANRYLVFDVPTSVSSGLSASIVLGQADFNSGGIGLGPDRLNVPGGCAYGAGNRLFVADTFNHRVLVWNATQGALVTGAAAVNVLGQQLLTTSVQATAVNRMRRPEEVVLSGAGTRLFVSDTGNFRVLEFPIGTITDGMNAAAVIGQPDFVTNLPAAGPDRFRDANGLAFDPTSDRLWVSEQNHRVLQFNASAVPLTNGQPAADGLGHLDGTVMSFARSRPNDTANPQSFLDPADVAIDPIAHRMYVADRQNSRVLVFNLSVGNELSGGTPGHERVADFVIGQPDFELGGCTATATGLCTPQRLAVDATNNRLYVASTGQSRVMVYDTTSLSNGMAAIRVIGQSDFTSTGGASTATGLGDPWGIAIDTTSSRLWVTDRGNSRVLAYDLASGAMGPAAQIVLGQVDLTANGAATTQAGLRFPTDVAWDAVNGRLFVADQQNHRVVYYAGTITSGALAAGVLGQGDFGSAAPSTTQGGLTSPTGLAFDANKLYVSDQANNRILAFKSFASGSPAAGVFGQTSFTSGGAGAGIAGMSSPSGVEMVAGRLWCADGGGHRVLAFMP